LGRRGHQRAPLDSRRNPPTEEKVNAAEPRGDSWTRVTLARGHNLKVGLALRANLVAYQVGARLRRVRSPADEVIQPGRLSSPPFGQRTRRSRPPTPSPFFRLHVCTGQRPLCTFTLRNLHSVLSPLVTLSPCP
jgi:hypothetical protein